MNTPMTPQHDRQEDLIAFASDPETIKKAVEGSMNKRLKVLAQHDRDELEVITCYERGGRTTYSIDGGATYHPSIRLAISYRIRQLRTTQEAASQSNTYTYEPSIAEAMSPKRKNK